MLLRENLDDRVFEEIVDAARVKINDYFLPWTDQNAHDPGIMLIELFAWLTEMQQFFISQSEDREALFPLFAIEKNPVSPSLASVSIKGSRQKENLLIPAGFPLMAEKLRFEFIESCLLNTDAKCAELLQQHTVSERICLKSESICITGDTYLSHHGENYLFWERDGQYTRITGFNKTFQEGGGALFTINEACPRGTKQASPCLINADGLYRHLVFPHTADGFPYACFYLETGGQEIIPQSLELFVFEDGSLSKGERWGRVDNFYRSRAMDRHFILDGQLGKISFGDGINGAMPRGVILIASMKLTWGGSGNIASGQLRGFEYNGQEISLEQGCPSYGGKERESADEAFKKAARRVWRAAAKEDYERLILEMPDMKIDKVHTFAVPETGDNEPYRVNVVVQPSCGKKDLTAEERERIRRYLEPYRLACCEIEISAACYADIDIIAEIRIKPYGNRTGISRDIIHSLKEFFERNYLGFGALISRAELENALSAMDEVERVISIELKSGGCHASKNSRGDIVLSPEAVAVWRKMDLLIS